MSSCDTSYTMEDDSQVVAGAPSCNWKPVVGDATTASTAPPSIESDFDDSDSSERRDQFDEHTLGSAMSEDFSDEYDSDDCSDYDSSDDGDRTYSTRHSAHSGTSSVYTDSSEDEDYADLMCHLQGGSVPSNVGGGVPSLSAPEAAAPMPMSEGLDLNMLKNLRSELEQVGQMITQKTDGAAFLKRAHILASINWLSANLPSCVLDHLGQEIRESLDEDGNPKKDLKRARNQMLSTVHYVSSDDDMSEASDLSGGVDGDGSCGSFDSFMDDVIDEGRPQKKKSGPPSLGAMLKRNNKPTFQARRPSMSCVSLSTMETTDMEEEQLPSMEYFECALLFIDISGFTKLATLLDPENLSKVINSYFVMLVDHVFAFDGDIQKFAGDALFAEWRASPTMLIEQCVEAAAACGASLVRDCADFPVMAFGGIVDAAVGRGQAITHLNVHCGLGVGEMAGVHVGDSERRREYLYLGDTITQATEACDDAQLGEVVASARFHSVLKKIGNRIIDKSVEKRFEKENRISGSSHHSNSSFLIAQRAVSKVVSNYKSRVRDAKTRGITEHVDGLQVDALIEYRRLMSLYVHPVVLMNDVAAADDFKSSGKTMADADRHRDEAELRSVYVVFIKPELDVKLTGNEEQDQFKMNRLNDIMNLTTRELKRHTGHLRQFIVDDKGVVMIATFGLRGSTFPKMVSERALPATIALHNALQLELGVESRIGSTFGDVYCGAVGGELRHEYAVMGPSVNLAARLMCSSENPGILVDNTVRQLACKSYGFNALAPVVAKGYKDPVPIFEPLSPLERAWGRIEPNFVGRQDEILSLMKAAKEMVCTTRPRAKIAMISSTNGMGKSTLLAHAVEHVRKSVGKSGRKLAIAKHVSTEAESMTPFSAVKPLLLKILDSYRLPGDEQSVISAASSHFSALLNSSMALESLTAQSVMEGGTVLSASHRAESFAALCAELEAPPLIASYLMNVLLGLDITERRKRKPSTRSLVSFMARAFQKCAENAHLVVLAVDDLHHTDRLSWLVLQEIFEIADNVLIIGTSFTISSCTLRVEEDFWAYLNDECSASGQFLQLKVESLSKDDILSMTMKTLGLQKKDVTEELLNEVYVQSGGMPRFANEILEQMKLDAGSVSVDAKAPATSLTEIILHRIDSFDITVRNLLNVCAILGMSFEFHELLEALKDSSDAKEEDLRKETVGVLQLAVEDGVLSRGDVKDSDDSEAIEDHAVFTFQNEIWRSTLLRLMLASRKRIVHRQIAQSIEARMEDESAPVELELKLCGHWKSAGDTEKATSAALATGKRLQAEPDSPVDSTKLYADTLEMWGWNENDQAGVAGFSAQVLDFVGPSDLSSIVKLMVAMGSARSAKDERLESISAYEDALRVLNAGKASKEVKDRSIIFPAFTSLADAIEKGYIYQDASRQYEQAMLHRFLQETRTHGRLIHHIHALYLNMDLHVKKGEVDKAIAVQSVIRGLYSPEKHSAGLRKAYGMDSGAVSFSVRTFLQMINGDHQQATKACRTVLKTLVPKIETDFDQAFAMMYPAILVLNNVGYSTEACGFIRKVLIEPFPTHLQSSCLKPFFEPLLMWLDLCADDDTPKDKLDQYVAFASDQQRLRFGPQVNGRTARLGRCADSISAEICLLLSSRMPPGDERDAVVANGVSVAENALVFNRKQSLRLPQEQAYTVLQSLRALGGSRPPPVFDW